MRPSASASAPARRRFILSRLVIVADIETDALWEYRREAALHAGVRAAWSAPIVASDGQVVGTFAVFRRHPGIPLSRDYELMQRMAQIAGIAVERRAAEDALRNSESKFRGLFESVMEGVYQTSRDGRILVANPAFVNLLGYDSAEEVYKFRPARCTGIPAIARLLRGAPKSKASCATKNT